MTAATILAGAILAPFALLLSVCLWNALAWPRVARAGHFPAVRLPKPVLSILIPARDDESHLPDCLETALRQGAALLEVLVCDDRSTDGTARVVEEQARRDPRVRLIRGSEPPEGWFGKPAACARLAENARGEWLLFLDADTRLADGAAQRILDAAARRRATFLSCWPALWMEGFWERTLMPLLNFVVFTLYPSPLAFVRDDAALGLAHGACILVHASTYRALGGHAAVRRELFEDTRLARFWRERGERGFCLDGQDVVGVRMYGTFGEIRSGFTKNFYPAFRREWSFWSFMALHFVFFLLPFPLAAALFLGPPAGAAVPAAWGGATLIVVAWAAFAVLLMRAALALRFRHPLWSVLLHPLAETVLLGIGLSSWWACRVRGGVVWKGRRYRGGRS
jgi:glycosyltransferase involved in cell wall biosynthesis